ncbi:aminoacyltransferase [Anaerococcus sp. WCA-380-WT-2B]|uniref:Aminoacyltransferase n=1 Tax=Anaerococcus porci TaxID=2652269 RepID=A0A6N7VWE6_9FIRM|nr:peptidoglycan bridge formation glycyltransferase FemA/FemB family protein [Anaerococcus porci]MSS78383.1 aminoacyltransferase [Anaerococcus porci]
MKLDLNNDKQVKKYKKFLYKHPRTSIFQDFAWADVKDSWDSNCFYIEKNGEIKAAAQVLSIYNNKANKKLFYCPRGPVCDLNDINTTKEIIDEIRDFASNNDGFLVKFDPNYEFSKELVEKYEDNGIKFSYEMYTYIQFPYSMMLDIDGRNFEDVIQSYSKNGRKQVRKSYRQGFELYIGNREDIEIFYNITKEMSERKGINHRPKDYYYKLYDAFKDNSRISFVKYKGEFLSCSFLITFRNYSIALYGADNLKEDLGQSYFLDAEEIRYCCENNIRYYDLGGVKSLDISDGLYNFKRKLTNNNIVKWIGNIDCIIDKNCYNKFIEGKEKTNFDPRLNN